MRTLCKNTMTQLNTCGIDYWRERRNEKISKYQSVLHFQYDATVAASTPIAQPLFTTCRFFLIVAFHSNLEQSLLDSSQLNLLKTD